MSTSGRVAVIGAGIVGARVARELLTPGPDGSPTCGGVVVLTRRGDRREQLAASFGRDAEVLLDDGRGTVPLDVDVVVVAREAGGHLDIAQAHLDAGRHVVSTSDDLDEVVALLGLSARAVELGRTLVVGAAMSPGLSCLLAAHAATSMDRVDEVHVARHGVAGPACARQRLRALRGTAVDWRDGEWVSRPGFSGRELDWFPDPIAGRDCYRAELAEPQLLVPAFPSAQRVTARLAASRRDRALAPFPVLVPPPVEGGLGATRVELRGERRGERTVVVYGALDRPGIVSGAVAAIAALEVLGGAVAPGATGLAGTGRHLEMLLELTRRGVRSAAFEGDTGSERPSTTQSAQDLAADAEESHAE